ncbi:MAG: sulfite exporter TauE/SafE family protein [Isosphaeraceae bacterium]
MTGNVAEIAQVLLLGFGAGILSGMFGIGGGLVIVPALMILFHVPLEKATGTSLFALLWPVGLLGVIQYARAGKLNVWQGAWIAVGLFLGAYFGARITLSLPRSTMKRVYAIFLLIVGAYYLWTSRPTPAETTPAPPAERSQEELDGQVH